MNAEDYILCLTGAELLAGHHAGWPVPPSSLTSNTRSKLLLVAFMFNNVQPFINAHHLPSTQPGLVVQSNDKRTVSTSVICVPGVVIGINSNHNIMNH